MAYTVTSYDTSPIISVTCKNEDGSVRNINGATAEIYLISVFSPYVIDSTFTGTIATGTDGVVTYALQENDIITPGEYWVKTKVTFATGEDEHFPQGKFGERIDVIQRPA